MNEVIFLVQGSAPEPYTVTFIKDGNNLTALCTCPAGEHGLYCKHRFAILDGNAEKIISDNKEDVEKVLSWAPGTDVDIAYKEVKEAERIYEEAKKNLSKLKKKLARAMLD